MAKIKTISVEKLTELVELAAGKHISDEDRDKLLTRLSSLPLKDKHIRMLIDSDSEVTKSVGEAIREKKNEAIAKVIEKAVSRGANSIEDIASWIGCEGNTHDVLDKAYLSYLFAPESAPKMASYV